MTLATIGKKKTVTYIITFDGIKSNPVYITSKKSKEQVLSYASKVYSGFFNSISIEEDVE